MKKEKIRNIQDLFITQMNHWILFCIAVTVIGLFQGQPPVMWQWLLCSLVPYAFFLVRRYTDHFLLFLGGHAAVIAPFCFLPYRDIVEQIALLFFIIGYLVYSIYLRIRTRERLDHPIQPGFAVGLSALMLLLQHYQGQKDWDPYYVLPLVAFMGLYSLQMYLEQYQYFMVVNDSSTGRIPQREMFRSGMTLVSLFSAGTAVLLLLISNVGYLSQIAGILKKLLVWILQLLLNGGEEEIQTETVQEQIVQQQVPDWMPAEETETWLLWQILEKVIFIAMYCAVTVFCIWGIYKLITFLYAHFHQTIVREKAVLETGTDLREKCEVERRIKEKKSLLDALSAKERIRRIYKREIWANRMKFTKDGNFDVLSLMTARECTEQLNRGVLAQVYEKARYSAQECTSEDVKHAKENF